MNQVVAVVTKYKRPANTGRICQALIGQPCHVVVADNLPAEPLFGPKYLPPQNIVDLWRWRINSGPACRWYPAIALAEEYRYILFLDDDYLPQPDLIERLLASADAMEDHFATLGAIGRVYKYRGGHWHYARRNVKGSQPTWVDMTGRGHFLLAKDLHHVFQMRRDVCEQIQDREHAKLLCREDDILLCCAIQRATGLPSYYFPGWIRKNLSAGPDDIQQGARPYHAKVRSEVINLCAKAGWKRVKP